MTSVPETAARAADDLRAVLSAPHSDAFRRTALTAAKVSIARALADAALDPATTPSAMRRFHATLPGWKARQSAYHDLPDTYADLLIVLDRLAAEPVAA